MAKNYIENKSKINKIKTTGFKLIPVIFYLIPPNVLENSKSICLINNLTGTECFGCGITRSVYWTLHLDFQEAFALNKGILLVFPLLVTLWIRNIKKNKRHIAQHR